MQRFLGCLNYVSDYFKDLRIICEPLYKRLRKNAPAWTEHHTSLVKEIKQRVKRLPCINIPHPNALLIVELDVSNFHNFYKIHKSNKTLITFFFY